VSLHNATAAPISLSGWKFTKGLDFTFGTPRSARASTSLSPRSGAIPVAAPRHHQRVGGWVGQLGNNGDHTATGKSTGAVQNEIQLPELKATGPSAAAAHELGHQVGSGRPTPMGWAVDGAWQTPHWAMTLARTGSRARPPAARRARLIPSPATIPRRLILEHQTGPAHSKSNETVISLPASSMSNQRGHRHREVRVDGRRHSPQRRCRRWRPQRRRRQATASSAHRCLPSQQHGCRVLPCLQRRHCLESHLARPDRHVGTQGANLLYQVDNIGGLYRGRCSSRSS